MDENNAAMESLDVQGFRFLTKADADKAVIDAGKISYIESHVGYATASALMAVYEKSIQNKIFGTPVGWSFLQDLRKRLLKMGVEESELTPIPMTVSFTREPGDMLAQVTAENAKKKKERKRSDAEPKPPLLILSFAMNLILLALIIVMFVVINVGETDNMINYKRNVNNRYATWEQELKEREQAVREKERELGVDGAQYENRTETDKE